MGTTEAQAFDLFGTYLQLADGPQVTRIPVDSDFWERIDERTELHAGRLLMGLRMGVGRSHWEVHPAGDEILVLLSGAATVSFRAPGGDRRMLLSAGEACVVPRGVWHMIDVHEAGDLLAITRGDGTEVRDEPPAEEERGDD